MTDPKALEDAVKKVNKLSPEAGETLRAIADVQGGNLDGAKARLEGEGAAHTGNPVSDKWIEDHKRAALDALKAGDKDAVIKNEIDMFNTQYSTAALIEMNKPGFARAKVGVEVSSFAGLKTAGELSDLDTSIKHGDQRGTGQHMQALGERLKAAVMEVIHTDAPATAPKGSPDNSGKGGDRTPGG